MSFRVHIVYIIRKLELSESIQQDKSEDKRLTDFFIASWRPDIELNPHLVIK